MSDLNSQERIQFASSIHIKNEEVDSFMNAWNELMLKFNIVEDYQSALFYI